MTATCLQKSLSFMSFPGKLYPGFWDIEPNPSFLFWPMFDYNNGTADKQIYPPIWNRQPSRYVFIQCHSLNGSFKTIIILTLLDQWSILTKDGTIQPNGLAYPKKTTFNPRTGGGGWFQPPPPVWFFADSEKTAARSAAKFAIAVQPTIWHISKKKRRPADPKGHVTRSQYVTWPQVAFFEVWHRAKGTPVIRTLWNSQCTVRAWVSTICIFRIFYIGDLGSCQFRDLPIISQW